jgi:glycosyltransferase involved in cell wall biosynthesis
MSLRGLRIVLVGPLPPPEGGMANQTRQLAEQLESEGAVVTLVRTNTPYRPSWIGRLRLIRAAVRLLPYVVRLWRASANAEVVHIMANSGWAWYLCATPAILVACMRGVPSVVNYHGGEAQWFLERSGRIVLFILGWASALAVPSAFLQQVFGRCGVGCDVVPNIVDPERFSPTDELVSRPHVVVPRNLEPIYDVPTALRAFARIRAQLPAARLTVAGSGPERLALQRQAANLGIADAVDFCGRLSREQMAALYRSARVVLNPSRVDNMPISVLEGMASGVPLVSTNVGGVPFILRDDVNALLVEAGDDAGMAAAALRVLKQPAVAERLRNAALQEVEQYTWPQVKNRWASVYASVRTGARVSIRPA